MATGDGVSTIKPGLLMGNLVYLLLVSGRPRFCGRDGEAIEVSRPRRGRRAAATQRMELDGPSSWSPLIGVHGGNRAGTGLIFAAMHFLNILL